MKQLSLLVFILLLTSCSGSSGGGGSSGSTSTNPDTCTSDDVAFSLEVEGLKSSGCSAISCQSNYEVNAGACLPISCTVSNAAITNATSVTGDLVVGCTVTGCESEYLISSNSCQGIPCDLTNALGNGVTSLEQVLSATGLISDDSCLVASCATFYKPALDSKSCAPKLCSELTTDESTALGFTLTPGAVLTGTYPSCTLTCSSSFQELTPNGKACQDKNPSGTITFAQNYTKILTPNSINITSVDAQQLQFYSNNSCSVAVGSPISLPASSVNIDLSAGDGTKTAYARFINGSKSTGCLSDTIILDQTAPVLAVTYPANNANVAGNSLVVTGTCSEANAPTVTVGISLNSVTQNANCSSGSFSSTFNITAVPVGARVISLSATDLAGNIGTNTSNFNRINCGATQTVSGNSCVDIVPTGTIAFDQNYTNLLTPNTVNLTYTNALNIQFYSDVGCVTPAGSPVAVASSLSLTLSAGNGTKTAYAKFVNGTAFSTCLTDTIILDQTAPALAVTYPAASTQIAGDTLIITGTCSEVNPSSVEVAVTLNSESQNEPCSSGNFSSTFDISALAAADYTITLSATDLAGNTGTGSQTFSRITCASGESVSGNTCVENIPSIISLVINNKNTSGYVKDSSLDLSISGSNAQQMKLSYSSDCSDGAYESYSISKIFSIALLNSVSVQKIYIKLKNINLETTCFTASGTLTSSTSSFIHDSIAPNLTITAPTAGSQTSASSVTVSGACETGRTVFVREASLSETSTNCTSSAYSLNFGITSPLGAKVLSVRQLDLADNQSEVSVTITKAAACVVADAPTYYVDLTNAKGITGSVPNCIVSGCNNGYVEVNNDKACAKNNYSTHTTLSTSNIVKVKTFDGKIFLLSADGLVRTVSAVNGNLSSYTVDATLNKTKEMEIVNNQLLFLTTNTSTDTWKIKKYATATPTSAADVFALPALSTTSSRYEFLRFSEGEGAADSKRLYVKAIEISVDLLTQIQKLYQYENSIANNFTTGGTYSLIVSSGNLGQVSTLGQTTNCFYFVSTSADPVVSSSLNRVLRSDGVSGNCATLSGVSFTTSSPNSIQGSMSSSYLLYGLGLSSSFSGADQSMYTILDSTTTPVNALLGLFALPLSGELFISDTLTDDGAGTYFKGVGRITDLSINTVAIDVSSYPSNPDCYYKFTAESKLNSNYKNKLTLSNDTIVNIGLMGFNGATVQGLPSQCPSNDPNGAALGGESNLMRFNSISKVFTPINPVFSPLLSYHRTYKDNAYVFSSIFYLVMKKDGTSFDASASANAYLYKYNSVSNKLEIFSAFPFPQADVTNYYIEHLSPNFYIYKGGDNKLYKVVP